MSSRLRARRYTRSESLNGALGFGCGIGHAGELVGDLAEEQSANPVRYILREVADSLHRKHDKTIGEARRGSRIKGAR